MTRSLQQSRETDFYQILWKQLQSENSVRREIAIGKSLLLDAKQSLSLLAVGLSDPTFRVRAAAVEGLDQLLTTFIQEGNHRLSHVCLQQLKFATTDHDLRVQSAAFDALRHHNQNSVVEQEKPLLTHSRSLHQSTVVGVVQTEPGVVCVGLSVGSGEQFEQWEARMSQKKLTTAAGKKHNPPVTGIAPKDIGENGPSQKADQSHPPSQRSNWGRLGEYSRLAALRFRTKEHCDKIIDELWREDSPLNGLPRAYADGRTLVVPNEAVPLFNELGIPFEEQPVE